MKEYAIRRYTKTLSGFVWEYTGIIVKATNKEEAVKQVAGNEEDRLLIYDAVCLD